MGMCSLEDFLKKIRAHLLEQCVYSRADDHLSFAAGEIPPIIPPAFRGPIVYNLELEKKSEFLKGTTTPEGKPSFPLFSQSFC